MAYKVFTNGSPLPASDLNTYLMNQSVMVFADSTARSAALTAPTEGMVTYLEDTGLVYVFNGSSWVDINDNTAAIPKSTVTTAGDLIVGTGNAAVTRLGIGTNGQVLTSNGTTATWATPAGGSETWTELIAPTNFPAAASVTLTGFAAKNKYLLLVNGASSATASGEFLIRLNSDSGSNYYRFVTRILGNTSWTENSLLATYGNNNGFYVGNASSSATSTYVGSFLIRGTQSTGRKPVQFNFAANPAGGQGQVAISGQGYWQNSASVTSMTLSDTAGNWDAGQYTLLGAD
jgi:hypothetical protein